MKKTTNNNAAKSNTLINVIIVVVIVAFVAVGVFATYGKISASIEDKAIASGQKQKTVEYLAKQSKMSVSDYLSQYGLSVGGNITEKTTENDMMDNMTLENYLKYTGETQSVDEVIAGTGLTDKVTKDTLWKDYLPQVPVISVLGEENFNQAKQSLGLGDEVTAETPYGEFEKIVSEKTSQNSDTAAASAAPAAAETPAAQ